jgi:hypothetical protein
VVRDEGWVYPDAAEVGELCVCVSLVSAEGRGRGEVPVSTFILTTPFETAVFISSFVDPDPPWNTRYLSSNS